MGVRASPETPEVNLLLSRNWTTALATNQDDMRVRVSPGAPSFRFRLVADRAMHLALNETHVGSIPTEPTRFGCLKASPLGKFSWTGSKIWGYGQAGRRLPCTQEAGVRIPVPPPEVPPLGNGNTFFSLMARQL
jgi:hypothetical protein